MEGYRALGLAVIRQAIRDAFEKHDSQNRQEARSFLCGSTSGWNNSLEIYCAMAECSAWKIRKQAKAWEKEGWPPINNLRKFCSNPEDSQ